MGEAVCSDGLVGAEALCLDARLVVKLSGEISCLYGWLMMRLSAWLVMRLSAW